MDTLDTQGKSKRLFLDLLAVAVSESRVLFDDLESGILADVHIETKAVFNDIYGSMRRLYCKKELALLRKMLEGCLEHANNELSALPDTVGETLLEKGLNLVRVGAPGGSGTTANASEALHRARLEKLYELVGEPRVRELFEHFRIVKRRALWLPLPEEVETNAYQLCACFLAGVGDFLKKLVFELTSTLGPRDGAVKDGTGAKPQPTYFMVSFRIEEHLSSVGAVLLKDAGDATSKMSEAD